MCRGGSAVCVGGLISVAQPLSFVVLGSVIHYSALTGKGIYIFLAHLYCAPF